MTPARRPLAPPEPAAAARLDIDLGAVVANWRTTAALSHTRSAGVVKADAYGVGLVEVAGALGAAGCDTFFVARLSEGVALRPHQPKARIYVLDGATPDTVPTLVAHTLTPVLNSLEQIAAWQSIARRDAAIHIDTGMNRLGLPPDELATLVAESRTRLKGLSLVLLLSHLACADDPAHPMNPLQRDRFRAALAKLPPAPASLASTGGVLLGRDYAFDLVRPGVGLYGGNPQPGRPNAFRRVVRLTGKILQLTRVDASHSVGYGASYRPAQRSLVATVALGYADGLMRVLGNRGKAAIGGALVPIIGHVSMDMITLDVSALKAPPAVGDDVEFLGDTISLETLAADCGTISYEILTSLSRRARRLYQQPSTEGAR